MAVAPPGWYPDPQGLPGSQRCWNGATWTEDVQALGSTRPPVAAPTSGRLAGYGQRLGGWLLDWVIVWVGSIAVLALAGGFFHTHQTIHTNNRVTFSSASFGIHSWGLLVVAAVVVGYGTLLCGSTRGQTLGMMAVGVRVVDGASGEPIGYWRALGRALIEYVLALAFFLPWVLDMLFPLWDSKNQTLHDKAMGSVVVNKSVGYP
jgi:uncharacterized RDD family membrane protein YckC